MGFLEQSRVKPLLADMINKFMEDHAAPIVKLVFDDEDKLDIIRLKQLGFQILDPKLDPDPYGLHHLTLAHRLETMGWEDKI